MQPYREYEPGQGVTFYLRLQSNDVLVDPFAFPVLTVHFPDGSSVTPTVVRDGVGMYHGQALVPFTMPPGNGFSRWQTTGPAVGNNALRERPFKVLQLKF